MVTSTQKQRIFSNNLTPWETLNLEGSGQRPCAKDKKPIWVTFQNRRWSHDQAKVRKKSTVSNFKKLDIGR